MKSIASQPTLSIICTLFWFAPWLGAQSISDKPLRLALPYDELVAAGQSDASLHALAIPDVDRIIAVGDRGVIWTSDNAGRDWALLDSQTTANLHAIDLGQQGLGIIAGGWIGSYTRTSHAILLRSNDSGHSWTAIECDQLPRLTGVRVLGDRCVAWGDYSTRWKTSVFESADGGLTWRGLASAKLGHATAAAITDAGAVAAVDRLGRSWFSDSPATGQVITQPNMPLHCLHFTGQNWLACGAGGNLIISNDGRQWADLRVPLSPTAREACCWQTIEQVGDDIWVGGSPGSILLHSEDRGFTWRVLKTGQTLPLSDLSFSDRNRGWATGPMGLILATRDGGRTWYVQRQKSRRLGILSLASEAKLTPWSALIAAAWEDRVAVASVCCTEVDPIEQSGFLATSEVAYGEIAPQVGCVAHSRWNLGSSAPDRPASQLALELLCWRPDVLLVSSARTSAGTSSAQLTAAALSALRVCRGVADGSLEFAQELDLPAWNVGKLVVVSDDRSGHFYEQGGRILRGPGVSIWDLMLPLPPADRRAAMNVAMQTLWAQSQAKAVSSSLLGGIPPSAETARDLSTGSLGNYQLVLGRVHREKSLAQLANSAVSGDLLPKWASDFDFVVRALPKREQAPLLVELAGELNTPKTWAHRQTVLRRLIDMVPEVDAADWARLQLLTLVASDEHLAWQKSGQGQQGLQLARADDLPLPIPELSGSGKESWNATPFNATPAFNLLPGSDVGQVVSASAVVPVVKSPAPSGGNWLELVDEAGRHSAKLLTRPDIELLAFRSKQKQAAPTGQNLALTRHLEQVMASSQLLGWPQMAEQELLLGNNQVGLLRWSVLAMETNRMPVLDGQLDEACWNIMPPMQLEILDSSAAGDLSTTASAVQPSTVRWAYDRDYLYIGITCWYQEQSLPGPILEPRDYDDDISGADHVHLYLDTDRDYCTAIELAVAADGRTYDRCCGFREYNPKWHVYVKQYLDRWTAEIAVELKALTTDAELAGSAWAVSARRIHPQGLSQSWSRLRTHAALPQASGLLLFVSDKH